MKVDNQLKSLIDKISRGDFDKYAGDLSDTEFGLYIPAYSEKGMIRSMPAGFSQTESNLKIQITKKSEGLPDADAQTVAWVGSADAEDSKCRHGGTFTCRHCTKHGTCRHCTGHKDKAGPNLGLESPGLGLKAPELNYDQAAMKLTTKQDVLKSLAQDGVGLALLHGHNDMFKFTELPAGYVSVISNGETHFRKEEDVMKDDTFVPNVWRFVDGVLKPAGGFSEI